MGCPFAVTSILCFLLLYGKKKTNFLRSVRSLSALFWPRVQHTGCLLPLTSTHVENKHLARQGSINNATLFRHPIVSAAAVFCLTFLFWRLRVRTVLRVFTVYFTWFEYSDGNKCDEDVGNNEVCVFSASYLFTSMPHTHTHSMYTWMHTCMCERKLSGKHHTIKGHPAGCSPEEKSRHFCGSACECLHSC